MKFSEKFAIDDLARNAVSNLTQTWADDRVKNGINSFTLQKVIIRDDSLFIYYHASLSYDSDGVGINVNTGHEVPDDHYVTAMQVEGVTENLGTVEEWNSFSPVEQKQLLKEFIHTGMSRVHCTCPAYLYQSHWESMSGIDADIWSFPGPKGTGIWKSRHSPGLAMSGISICKHLYLAVYEVDRNLQSIWQFVRKAYKKLPHGSVTTSSATVEPSAPNPSINAVARKLKGISDNIYIQTSKIEAWLNDQIAKGITLDQAYDKFVKQAQIGNDIVQSIDLPEKVKSRQRAFLEQFLKASSL